MMATKHAATVSAGHNTEIPNWITERVVSRRGRRHIFDDLVPKKSALVVVDLQNAFVQEGNYSYVPMARAIVPNVNRAAAALREAGGAVVWLQHTVTDESLQSWSVLHETLSGGVVRRERLNIMRAGAAGHDLWPELDVRPADEIVTKTRYSAFIDGSSNLDAILRGRGIDCIAVAGTVTSVCCESTARDAMMRNYKTIMLSDGNAARNDWEHSTSLSNFYLTFGDVMATDDLINYLRRNTEASAKS